MNHRTMFTTARVIRSNAVAIMAATLLVSYSTQRQLFLSWKCDELTATIAPIAIDLLAVSCTLAIHSYRSIVAGLVLVVTGGSSVAANFIAGETTGSKVVHGGMVVLYLLAELVATLKRRRTAQPHNAPTSPGMPPIEVEPEEAIRYREAVEQMRRESRLAALNG
jgi:hypothetical protein